MPGGPPGLFINVYELARPAPVRYFACRVRARGLGGRGPGRAPPRRVRSGPRGGARRRGSRDRARAAGSSRGSTGPPRGAITRSSDGSGYLVERENIASGWRADGGRPGRAGLAGQRQASRGARARGGARRRDALPGPGPACRDPHERFSPSWSRALLLARPCLAEAPARERRRGRSRPGSSCPSCAPSAALRSRGLRATDGAEGSLSMPALRRVLSRRRRHPPPDPRAARCAGYDPHYFAKLPQVEGTALLVRAPARGHPLRLAAEAFPTWPVVRSSTWAAEAGVSSPGSSSKGFRSREPVTPTPKPCGSRGRGSRRPCSSWTKPAPPPLAPGQAMLGFFDVLEHIDDDLGTLRWAWQPLEPGGILVLTVPAHPFLFDDMDRLAHHRRRYRRHELRAGSRPPASRCVTCATSWRRSSPSSWPPGPSAACSRAARRRAAVGAMPSFG